MNNNKKTLAIIDFDGFLFRASWQYRELQNFTGIFASKKKLDEDIQNILEKIEPDFYLGFHGKPGSKCFRYNIATIKPYKEARNNRSDLWAEYFKPSLKDHLKNKWNSHELEFIEADDACSIALNQYKDEYDIIMVYEDHDFYQLGNDVNQDLVGYNPNKKRNTIISKELSRYEWWLQMLTGCQGDSVPGIPGIGQDVKNQRTSKGHKILEKRKDDTNESFFEIVRDTYIEKYGEGYLFFLKENYLLLKMLKNPSFDYPKKLNIQEYKKKEETRFNKILNL